MSWTFNAATTLTNTSTMITFSLLDGLGVAIPNMQVRLVGSSMTYNASSGVLTGTVTQLQLYNSSTSTVWQTLALSSSHQLTAASEITTFLGNSLTFAANVASAGVAYTKLGIVEDHSALDIYGNSTHSEVWVQMLNASNAVVGYMKLVGYNFNASSEDGVISTLDILTAAGDPLASPKHFDYSSGQMTYGEALYGLHANNDMFYTAFAAGDDTLTVNAANTMVLDGGLGSDTITGSAGIDTVSYYNATAPMNINLGTGIATTTADLSQDTITGVENVIGSRFQDDIYGTAGNNIIDGGADNVKDNLFGGAGDDIYLIRDAADTISDSLGTDTVRTTMDNTKLVNYIGVERLEMFGATITGTGNSLNNTIIGNANNNVINGGTGADTMQGGAGNDTYVVDNAGDLVVENAGEGTADAVYTSTSYALTGTNQVEFLYTNNSTLTSNINLTGNTYANTITGNAGVNVLDGGSAGSDGFIDTLNGLGGNDTYVLGSGSDIVNDTAGIDTITTTISRDLNSYATIENLVLVVGAGAINATGNALANTLVGNNAANTMTGGGGNDTMTGGAGNDTFVWDAQGLDKITDFSATYLNVTMNGAAVVPSSTSTATGSGTMVMNLGQTRVDLTLNTAGLDWNSTSTAANKVTSFGFYTGAAGVNGTLGHDVMADAAGYKSVNASTGVVKDTWTTANGLAAPGATAILAGNEYLQIGTTSTGSIRGQITSTGLGADKISVVGLNIGDFATIQELATNAGTDVILKRSYNNATNTLTLSNTQEANLTAGHFLLQSATTADNLVGTAYNDDMFGAAGNDTLTGGAGNDRLFGEANDDRLDGGAGNDTMFGGSGNDTYVVDSTGDSVIETAGNGALDKVQTSLLSYALGAAADIEYLETTNAAGTTNVNLTGNGIANNITGNAGNNILDGKVGADTMTGGAGNDTYIVDNAGDVVIDSAGTLDTVKTSVSYTLAAGQGIDVLTYNSTSVAINLTGNELAQKIVGNGLANIIDGGSGNDTLTGGAGNDYFQFSTVANTTTNKDSITDFVAANDQIILKLSAFAGLGATGALASFKYWQGTAAHDLDDRIIYNNLTGELHYDSNGSAAGGDVVFAVLTNKGAMTFADFTVI